MKMQQWVIGVDSHTAGEPTRVLIGGLPLFLGSSIVEQQAYAQAHLDHLRTALVKEPRGHDGIVLAYVLPSTNPAAQYGVIFANTVGYFGMCGHGLIGVATVLAELGMIQVEGNRTEIMFDTVAGLTNVSIEMNNQKVLRVVVRNVPSFVFDEQVQLKVGAHMVQGDIAYGGNWFFLVPSIQFGLTVDRIHFDQLLETAIEIGKALALSGVEGRHPGNNNRHAVDFVKIYSLVHQAGESAEKSFVLCPGNAYDRSPCGTGTSAHMALLYKHGKLTLCEEHSSMSVLGSTFVGRAIGETQVGNLAAITTEIFGTAYITSICQFVIDTDDPFRFGIPQ
jgi:proline racemase